jgi:hypothetical protein
MVLSMTGTAAPRCRTHWRCFVGGGISIINLDRRGDELASAPDGRFIEQDAFTVWALPWPNVLCGERHRTGNRAASTTPATSAVGRPPRLLAAPRGSEHLCPRVVGFP